MYSHKVYIFTDCKEKDFSYQGHCLKEIAANNDQQCQEYCSLEPGCHFWTWFEMKCQLKPFEALQNRIQKQGAVSGTANCPGKAILIFQPLYYIPVFVKINCNNCTCVHDYLLPNTVCNEIRVFIFKM